MRDTAKQIKPALTPEEWEWAQTEGVEFESEDPTPAGMHCWKVSVTMHPRETEKPDDWGEEGDEPSWHPDEAHLVLDGNATISETHAFDVMALLNFILPNDDPRKITREDVERLLWENRSDDSDPDGFYRTLAAKLAALLPPEESH